MDATSWQPCGSLDFSVLTSPTLKVRLRASSSPAPLKVKVFAVGVNWLDFRSGKCTVRFT